MPKKIHYKADGAGCFASNVSKAAMLAWKEMTGKQEISYRISVAGDGKTKLDGSFEHFSAKLKSAVKMGRDFHDAETICDAIEGNGGGELEFLDDPNYAPGSDTATDASYTVSCQSDVKLNANAIISTAQLVSLNNTTYSSDNQNATFPALTGVACYSRIRSTQDSSSSESLPIIAFPLNQIGGIEMSPLPEPSRAAEYSPVHLADERTIASANVFQVFRELRDDSSTLPLPLRQSYSRPDSVGTSLASTHILQANASDHTHIRSLVRRAEQWLLFYRADNRAVPLFHQSIGRSVACVPSLRLLFYQFPGQQGLSERRP